MSGAISGSISLNGSNINKKYYKDVDDKFSIYKFDIKREILNQNVYLWAGLIVTSKQSEKEIIPYYLEKKNLFIVADAAIYNRKELIHQLKLNKNITDSQIILESYIKWGNECPKYLVGDFAFVIYDCKKNKILCTRDHMGSRCLYYSFDDNIFSFSTLVEPLNINKNVNEKWLAEFLALKSVVHQIGIKETIYDGVFQVLPATSLIIENGNIREDNYWQPLKNKKVLNLKTDDDYINRFKEIFTEAVESRSDSNSDISIKLSGGMDSTSVAAIASEFLKNKNKKLYSYTSIPIDEYKDDLGGYRFANEKEYVEELVKMYPNIETNYLKSEGLNSLSNMNQFIGVLEQPYKNFQNIFWADNILKKAYQKNSRVILSGQYGNYSISYGDYIVNLKTLLEEKKITKVINEVYGASRIFNESPFKTLRYIRRAFNAYNMQIQKTLEEKYKYSPINLEFLRKWNIDYEIEQSGMGDSDLIIKNLYDTRRKFFNPIMLNQIGSIETKLSLANGVVVRDPTRDIRVIEFCLSLPNDQFVRKGEERYLIKRAMKGVLPDKIRLNSFKKGLQSADWIQRLEGHEIEICNILNKVLLNKECCIYIDKDKIEDQLVNLKSSSISDKSIDVRLILISICLYKFIIRGGEQNGNEKLELSRIN